jgi:hypothetical protein
MNKRSGLLTTAVLTAGLALSTIPAVAGASTAFSPYGGTGWYGPEDRLSNRVTPEPNGAPPTVAGCRRSG